MKLKTVETPGIAHYAYVIAEGGQAVVVDPCRFIEPYLQAAREFNAQIKYIVETHRHEDFAIGSSQLAEITGAKVVNGDFETFGRGDLRLEDGGVFEAGRLHIRALHTPGHTPESMSYVIYPSGLEEQPWGVFTGDAMFYGTTGRTDLPDAEKSVQNAALLYDSIHAKFSMLPDKTIILPAHGPGSVCGGGMQEKPFSTLGEERQYNEVFTLGRKEFSHKKGGETLPRPPYFRLMERVNLNGGLSSAVHPSAVPLLDANEFSEVTMGALVIDTREPEAFAGGHVAGSYNIWLDGMSVFGGWICDGVSPIYLITDRSEDISIAAEHLSRIGIDSISGALVSGFSEWRKSGFPIEFSGTMNPRELMNSLDQVQILDVREQDEYDSGHIPGARHQYVGYLQDRLHEADLRQDQPVVVTCGVGHRAGLGVSILLNAGYGTVYNLIGGMAAWNALNLPIEN